MKKLQILIIAAVAMTAFCLSAKAQEDDCMLYMSYYQEYYKQGSKDSKMASLSSWRKAYSICKPGTRQNLYIHGADLYRMLISKNAKNAVYREQLIDTLITLHRLRAQYYPKYADKAYAALSKDVNNLLKNDPVKTHEILSEVIKVQGAKSDPLTFVASMQAAVKMYENGKLSTEDVINEYDNAMTCFAQIQQIDTTKTTREMKATVENLFINSHIASCENLIALFTPRYEENKDDLATVTKIVTLMGKTEGCMDNSLFLNAVTSMHQLDPSANSAYYLSKLHAAQKDNAQALKYMEEAANYDGIDDQTAAQYFYELSTLCLKNGLYVKAVDAAHKTVSGDAEYAGKAYMVIGHAWMSTSCPDGNEVERRAKYWVAADYFAKAKSSDASLAEECNTLINKCAAYYPQTAEAFMYDLQNGQSYMASCGGLHATTTVRTVK